MDLHSGDFQRGRKPGSKLSEASKMLRLLEKGLSTAKLKNSETPSLSYSPPSSTTSAFQAAISDERIQIPLDSVSQTIHNDDLPDEDMHDGDEETMIPVRLIEKERKKTSFFHTILNDAASGVVTSSQTTHQVRIPTDEEESTSDFQPPPRRIPRSPLPPTGFQDPISIGLLSSSECSTLFDLIFLRLNPFINLFDPAMHSVAYIRNKCPFLLCTLVAAGCRFWKSDLYEPVKRMAKEAAVRAFAEEWKSVEVCQAFACLTYWRDPDESKTWTYIGLACRLAVELGLNRYTAAVPMTESEEQRRERRNKERTYLVLWVHDRSLSMQTGRLWMLPESPLVSNSHTWHLADGGTPKSEDVIISAFVQLRRIGAETTDVFLDKAGVMHADVNYEVVLHGCNTKLTRWMDHWTNEMRQAGGQMFQMSMLSFFRLHVRLFLNTFGLQASSGKEYTNLHALSACYESGLQSLQIISGEFRRLNMLPYCQDSITVMTAYSAVCLLRLLRKTRVLREWREENALDKIYGAITDAASAFHEAVVPGQTTSSANYHARFLRTLVERDKWSTLPHEGSRLVPQEKEERDARHEKSYTESTEIAEREGTRLSKGRHLSNESSGSYPTTDAAHAIPIYISGSMHPPSADQVYWRNMHIELGLNGVADARLGELVSSSWTECV